MKRLMMLFAAVSLVCFAMAGCSAGALSGSETEGAQDVRVITDMLGRQVEIPAKIERVAVAGSTARILTYAGCSDKIAGVTEMDKTNDVNMPISVVNDELFAKLPSVGAGGSKDISYEEELILLSPDVIFANKDKNTADKLQEKTNIPVVCLAYEGIFADSVYDALILIGDIMGKEEHCAKLVRQLKEWQEDLHNRAKDVADADKPAVYVGGVSYKGPLGFEGTYGHYPPFTAINAKNVVDETGYSGVVQIDLEKVLTWQPDIIFLNPTNMDLINDDYKKRKSYYDGLKAIKEGRVYSQVSYNYNSTNIEIAIADAYYAGKIIYPEQFADIDFAAKADEIFQVMLGRPFYRQLAEAGIGFGPLTIGK